MKKPVMFHLHIFKLADSGKFSVNFSFTTIWVKCNYWWWSSDYPQLLQIFDFSPWCFETQVDFYFMKLQTLKLEQQYCDIHQIRWEFMEILKVLYLFIRYPFLNLLGCASFWILLEGWPSSAGEGISQITDSLPQL